MGKLSRMASGRRDWVEAVWAEAHDVPPGWPRLAWRAGGVWLIVRQALMIYRPGRAVLFAVAAAAAAWGAWPRPPAGHALVSQVGVITTVLLLAGLPLLARRFLGPASESRAGRFLRVGWYAAILALLPALAIIGVFAGAVPRQAAELRVFEDIQGPGVPGTSSGGPTWWGEIPILLLTASYLAVLVWMTSQRSRVTGPTLAIGTGAGLRARRRHVLGGTARTLQRMPAIRGCRARRSIRSWCSRGSSCSARRRPPRCSPPGGAAADRAAPSSWPRPGWARASPPGCWRTWSARCSSPLQAPARPR